MSDQEGKTENKGATVHHLNRHPKERVGRAVRAYWAERERWERGQHAEKRGRMQDLGIELFMAVLFLLVSPVMGVIAGVIVLGAVVEDVLQEAFKPES